MARALHTVLLAALVAAGQAATLCTNCTIWSHLPCRATSVECEIPRDPSKPEVGPVLNLGREPIGRYQPVANTPLYLNVSWEIPVSGYMFVTGFLVQLIDRDGLLPTTCYHLDMANARWTLQDRTKKIRIYFVCAEVTWDARYWLTVLTLPNQVQASPNITIHRFQRPNVTFDVVASKWTTVVSLVAMQEKNQIWVTFSVANLTEFNFTFKRYKVTLVNQKYPRRVRILILSQHNQSMPVIFTNVCEPGTWRAKVEPLEMGGLKCRRVQGLACENSKNTCQPCLVSTSLSMSFEPAARCRRVPLHGGPAFTFQKVATVIGICVGCLLAATLVAVLIFHSKSCSSGIQPSTASIKPSQQKGKAFKGRRKVRNVAKSKRVLLLYEEDHQLHTEVVHHLACFLQQHCKCDVTYDQWDLQSLHKDYIAWLMKHLEVSNIIILIHSEGGYRKYRAKKARKAYNNGPSPKIDLFVPGVEMIISEKFRGNNGLFKSSENTVSTYMPYTSPDFVIAESATCVYELMTDIQGLVRHIHGVSADVDMRGISGKVNSAQFTELSSGIELTKAIDRMRQYITENPNWFAETHRKTSTDIIRDDSGRGTLQAGKYSHKDNCRAAEERQYSHSAPGMAAPRHSFQSNPSTISSQDNVRSSSKLSIASKSTESSILSSGETLGMVPEADDSPPLPHRQAGRGGGQLAGDGGLGASTYTPSLGSRSSKASSCQPLYAEEEQRKATVRSRTKSVSSNPDYSAIVDSAFELALDGESSGEPDS